MNSRGRVVVIGAGPAGLATALALQAAGFDALAYERRGSLGDVGTALTLWPNGLSALATFGADVPVRAHALAAPGMSMRSHTGRVLSEFSGSVLDAIGGRGAAIHRAELLTALSRQLGLNRILFNARCIDVRSQPDGATAVFDDGTHVEADLVVGADGVWSRVRSACGIPSSLAFGGFTVWRAVVRFPLLPYPGTLTFGGPHQFGLWRLPEGRAYWFASAPTTDTVQRPIHSRPPDLFAGWHEPIGLLIAATPTDQITATDVYDSAPLASWSAGRVVLVGDAAHPTLPNMGQGTSQAFEDAAVLANALARGTDIGRALLDYESVRRPRARSVWSQARLMARLGSWRGGFSCWLRDQVMAAMPEPLQLGQLERLFAFPA